MKKLVLLGLTLFLPLALSIPATAGTVYLYPSDNVQDVVNANAAGTTYVFTPGTYRMQSITPKSGDTYEGESGAILNGSRLLTSFSKSGSYYIVTGQTQHGTADGECEPGYAACIYPEDLFFNSVPLQRVTALSDVTTGKWYFDYSTGTIYFINNPSGETVEIGVTPHAFSGSATNVTIKDLTIEKYAAPGQDGAISAGHGWTIENNYILLNHGMGIRLNNNLVVSSNYIHNNGEEGLGGMGSDVLVENNEIAYNNTLGYDYNWAAGGSKYSETTDLVVEGNYVHNNNGPGISLDAENYDWVIQGNRTTGNYIAGIIDEISYNGTARYNIIENDATYPGKPDASMWWACGIQNLASSNADVYGNTLIDDGNGICADSISRGSGNRGAYLVQNFSVYNNVIVQSTGSAAGIVADPGEYMDVYSSSWNNHFIDNIYKLSTSGDFYVWQSGSSYTSMNASDWRALGQDTNGTWISTSDSDYPSTKFSPSQAVETIGSTQVWSLPTTGSTLVSTEGAGEDGTVTKVAGPILNSGTWWWNVTYGDGHAGWSEESDLEAN